MLLPCKLNTLAEIHVMKSKRPLRHKQPIDSIAVLFRTIGCDGQPGSALAEGMRDLPLLLSVTLPDYRVLLSDQLPPLTSVAVVPDSV